MDKIDKFFWEYMIKNGKVDARWNFYGSCYEEDEEERKILKEKRKNMVLIGIRHGH